VAFADIFASVMGHEPLEDMTPELAAELPVDRLREYAQLYESTSKVVANAACHALVSGTSPDLAMAAAREAVRIDESLVILIRERTARTHRTGVHA
jgi:hypothetical protein